MTRHTPRAAEKQNVDADRSEQAQQPAHVRAGATAGRDGHGVRNGPVGVSGGGVPQGPTGPTPDEIGDEPHDFGFDFHGLIRVVRACCSRPESKSRWAAIRVYAANGTRIDIDVMKTSLSIRVDDRQVYSEKAKRRKK